MATKVPTESRIPVLGKSPPPTKPLSRLASFSNKVRAHLSPDSSKLRPGSGMLLGLLGQANRNKSSKRSAAQRPQGFYQPLPNEWHASSPQTTTFHSYLKSEDCSPEKEEEVLTEREKINSAHIGKKVCVTGCKIGILRFYGPTDLGPGNWCGIELESADGTSDGLVNGVRYFSCAALHGILEPESKVCLISQIKAYLSEVSSSGPHSLLGLPREDVAGSHSDTDEVTPPHGQGVEHRPSGPPSQISTPGSSNSGIPLFDLAMSSRHSSASSLVPRTAALQDMSVQSKHSSFELDESLGILTPDQMSDFTLNGPLDYNLQRTPSAEELSSFMLKDETFDEILENETLDDRVCLLDDQLNKESESECALSKKNSEPQSLSSSLRTSKKDNISRTDRTPSLEDLPLDICADTTDEAKSESTKSIGRVAAPPNSFITSITSITSLDNGYQGDGEWSRPASRGPDHSPSAQSKSVKARLDPMTDSDFFTESDADMHEECAGHRRAQVIDGTLYGGIAPQSGITQSVQVGHNNHIQRFSPTNEEMDSSGIYSDLDKKYEEPIWEKCNVVEDERIASPEGSIMTVSSKSDQSLKKISPTAFSSLISEKLDTIKNMLDSAECDIVERNTGTEETSDAKKARSETSTLNKIIEGPMIKKYKMPKRNVVSKIKTMMTSTPNSRKDGDNENQENRIPTVTRPAKKGRWDAVMNKIAQGQAEEKTTPKLKEVKSKVYSGISGPGGKQVTPPRPVTASGWTSKSPSARCLSAAQSISTRSLRDISSIKTKCRRTRIRSSESSLQGATPGSQASSRNSSISDLSQTKPSPTTRSSKKREARCTSPQSDGSTNSAASQAARKSPPTPQQNQPTKQSNNVKNVGNGEKQGLVRKTTPRRSNLASLHKPQPLRDHNRLNHGGNKTEPVFQASGGGGGGGGVVAVAGGGGKAVAASVTTAVRAQPIPQTVVTASESSPKAKQPITPLPHVADIKALAALRHSAKGAEALAVLVNYLVYTLEAFSTPQLKRDLDIIHKEWVKTKLELEETKMSYNRLEDSFKNEKEIHELSFEEAFRSHEEEKNELNAKFREEYTKLSSFHEEKLNEIKTEFDRKVTVLREQLVKQYENDLQEVKNSHQDEIASLMLASNKEKSELKEIYSKSIEEFQEKEEKLTKQLAALQSQCDGLKENETLFINSLGKNAPLKISRQKCTQLESEVDSLRSVLDLKSSELLELRRQSQVWQRDAEQLPQALHREATLQARLEGLQAQLNIKEANEQRLLQENRMLLDTIEKESTQKKRLSMHNEELQWKLKQNCEVVQALAALSGPVPVTRTKVANRSSYTLNKTASEADINNSRIAYESAKQNGNATEMFEDETSSPGSPKVKAVIEKADSVAWVVDIDENPQNIATRLLKRAQSLRGATPTPTPSKSAQHRPRNRSSQSLSISSTSSKSSPCTPELRKSPDCSASDQGWGDVANIDEVEHITEEVIVVKSIGDKNVLELLDVDDSEIQIDDLPKKEPSMEEMMMLRRMEQPGLRDKDSEQELDPCEFIIGKDIKLDNDDLKTRRRMTSSARHNRRLNKDTCRMNMELSWSEDGEGGFQTEE
ncbi:uncharacterized protein isoform X2 [Rhodnius prolixus]|uniref:uncharacterized protein isoform X2 n=1 Tax=Rhodnius prolixus TaxID=13249 RepID=UPI003D18819D